MAGGGDRYFFKAVLEEALGINCDNIGSTFESGGCINNAVKLNTNEGLFFLKWHANTPDDMFEKEADGLKLLANTRTIKIPKVLGFGKTDGKNYLLL